MLNGGIITIEVCSAPGNLSRFADNPDGFLPKTEIGQIFKAEPADAHRVGSGLGLAAAPARREIHQGCVKADAPAVIMVDGVDDIDQAIELANDTEYGLSAAIFTQDVDRAMRFAREVDSGNIHINWGPQWRADLMPYGGLKNSGMGKEGPKYAVEEMTETKMVVFHLKQ